jgi:hypothetical protein
MRTLAAGLVLAAVSLSAPAGAEAALTIDSLTAAPADATAAAHSDFHLAIGFGTPSDRVRDLTIELPAGLIGNPSATPRCTTAQLQADACAAETTVGSTNVRAAPDILPFLPLDAPGTVYNLEPSGGDPGRLGIVVRPLGGLLGKIVLESPITVRDGGDYGLTSTLTDMPRTLSGLGIEVNSIDLTLSGTAGGNAFMTNPTRCTPATTTVTATSYSGATSTRSAEFTPTACDSVPFAPTLEVGVQDPRTDVPTQVDVALRVPGDEGGRSQAHIRDSTVVLPEGFGLNPAVAGGLELCSPEQFGAGQDTPVTCPASSDIGDVTFDTAVLAGLRGNVYFGTAPDDPYRLFIVAEQGTLRVKLVASIRLDADTGQITSIFRDLPQFPLSRFLLTFRGGDRSVLATPPSCGSYTTTAGIVPWSGSGTRDRSATVGISQDGAGGCDQPSQPSAAATPTTRRARADTALSIDLVRRARDKPVRSVLTSLPDGLLGRLLSVPFCPDAEAAAGTCPESSRLGTVQVEIGSGPQTTTLDGTVSLAGPAPGALARLALSVPTKVGPIDLGTFAVQAPLTLGTRDGRVQVTAELPVAFKGVRLSLRRITLALTRAGFLFNPSGCANRRLDATFTALDGSTAAVASPYAVTECERLRFRPRARAFSTATSGRGKGARPPITLELRPRAADTALRAVDVAFSKDMQPNAALLASACDSAAVDAGSCPRSAIVATAQANSPLIPGELSGPAYLTRPEQPPQAGAPSLPGISVVLGGLGGLVRLRLDGRVRLAEGRLATRFVPLPDIPLTRFSLTLRAGALVATRPLCDKGFDDADVSMSGQNGFGRQIGLPIDFLACRTAPIVRIEMTALETTRPTVDVRIDRGPRGGRMRQLVLRLPRRLDVRQQRTGVTVTVGSRTLAREHWSLSEGGTLQIRSGLGSSGASSVRVRLRDGAVVPDATTRRLAAAGDAQLTFRLTARDTSGRLTRQRIIGEEEPARR